MLWRSQDQMKASYSACTRSRAGGLLTPWMPHWMQCRLCWRNGRVCTMHSPSLAATTKHPATYRCQIDGEISQRRTHWFFQSHPSCQRGTPRVFQSHPSCQHETVQIVELHPSCQRRTPSIFQLQPSLAEDLTRGRARRAAAAAEVAAVPSRRGRERSGKKT